MDPLRSEPEEKKRSRSRSPEGFLNKSKFPTRELKLPVTKPSLAGGLLSFKQFMELQHEPIPPFEAQQHYEDYKSKYERKHLEIFFFDHKNEHWFIEKYDPVISQKWQEERYLNAKISQRAFLEQASQNGFAGLKLKESDKIIEKISGPPYFGFDPNSMTLFLKTIPVNISRWDLLGVVKSSPGFVSLSMSEPLKSQGFSRFAWVLYDTEEHCNESLEILTNKPVTNEFRLNPVRSQSSSKKEPKLQPPQSIESLLMDWKQTSRLITAIDREKGIYENPLLIADELFLCMKDVEKEFQLDLQLVYLRKVHAFCYYCLEEYEDERMLAAKCAPAHIRTRYDPCAIRQISQDEAIESRLHKKTITFKYEKEKDPELQKSIEDFFKKNAKEEDENKVRCEICNKLFRGTEFIRKHIQTKHEDLISKIVKDRLEDITLENYINDSDKLTNQIIFATEGFKGIDRRKVYPKKRTVPELSYEDLDDPNRFSKSRRVVDYSDI